MDTIQLDHALESRTDIPSGIFKGTYAINQVPLVYALDKPYAFIINTDPWPQDGTHWVALFCKPNGVIEFFDSIGNPPPAALWKHCGNTTVVYNARRLQHHCTSVCGEYCILFIYSRLKDVSFDEFLSCFTNVDLLKNDQKVSMIVNKYFDVLPHSRPYPAISKKCVQISK
jgi:hypothetical protein